MCIYCLYNGVNVYVFLYVEHLVGLVNAVCFNVWRKSRLCMTYMQTGIRSA